MSIKQRKMVNFILSIGYYYLLLFVPLFLGCTSNSPDPPQMINLTGEKVWDKTFGGSGYDNLWSIIATPDGGYLLGGQSNSPLSGDKTQDSRGDVDYWVIKIGANGEKVWDKTFGGSGYDQLTTMTTTADGNFFLGGSSGSYISGDKTQVTKGRDDFWLIKINPDGKKIWDKALGSSNGEFLKKIIATPDGNFLIGGHFDSSVSGDKAHSAKGANDYWVVKISPMGEKIWERTFGGSNNEIFTDLVNSNDGGYLLGGYSISTLSGDKTEDSRGGIDYWVVKINSNGDKEWDRTLGGYYDELLTSIVATKDGYLLGGRSDSYVSGDKTQDRKGPKDTDLHSDYWVVKISEKGEKLWDKIYGGDNGETMYNMVATKDNSYLLCGYSASSVSGDKTQAKKGCWLVKITANGEKIWNKTFDVDTGLYGAVSTSEGGCLLGGSSDSAASDDKTQNSKGSDDYWVIKIK